MVWFSWTLTFVILPSLSGGEQRSGIARKKTSQIPADVSDLAALPGGVAVTVRRLRTPRQDNRRCPIG